MTDKYDVILAKDMPEKFDPETMEWQTPTTIDLWADYWGDSERLNFAEERPVLVREKPKPPQPRYYADGNKVRDQLCGSPDELELVVFCGGMPDDHRAEWLAELLNQQEDKEQQEQ